MCGKCKLTEKRLLCIIGTSPKGRYSEVAQRQSSTLLTYWSWVRSPPSEPKDRHESGDFFVHLHIPPMGYTVKIYGTQSHQPQRKSNPAIKTY